MEDEAPSDSRDNEGDDFDARVNGIAALGEPVRRALYRYVVLQPDAVNRDQVAQGAGVARHVAKFHLDKLVDDGLLDVDFRRPSGRRGPGAGRPAKFYRRSAREVSVSLPERHYELAGKLLARAIVEAERDGEPVVDALSHAAHDVGRGIGEHARAQLGKRAGASALLASVTDTLTACGYEPRVDDTGVTLVNCPFHALAQEYTELVCGMNLELMNGLVDGLERSDLEPLLDPAPGRCCVRLRTAAAAGKPAK